MWVYKNTPVWFRPHQTLSFWSDQGQSRCVINSHGTGEFEGKTRVEVGRSWKYGPPTGVCWRGCDVGREGYRVCNERIQGETGTFRDELSRGRHSGSLSDGRSLRQVTVHPVLSLDLTYLESVWETPSLNFFGYSIMGGFTWRTYL